MKNNQGMIPIEATNKKLPTIESSATLQSTGDECVISCDNYKSGSSVLQSSANASLLLALYAVVDGVDRAISCCAATSGVIFLGVFSVSANTSGFYVFEIPPGCSWGAWQPIEGRRKTLQPTIISNIVVIVGNY